MASLGLDLCKIKELHILLTYLKHLLDSSWLLGTILIDVSTENGIGFTWSFSIFAWLIVSHFFKQLLGDKCVQVVYEYFL
jgi:hypothetical protein